MAYQSVSRAGEQIHAVGNLWFITLAVTRKIDRNHAIPLRKDGKLVAPVIQVARPSVNQDQRFAALAIVHVMYARAVERRPAGLCYLAPLVFSRGICKGRACFCPRLPFKAA